MRTFSSNIKADLTITLFLIAVVSFLAFLSPRYPIKYFPYMLLLFAVLILINLLSFRLRSIQIDDTTQKLELKHINFFGATKISEFDLSQIEFTYKKQATSFRSGVKNVCSLYYQNNKIKQIAPNIDGWRDDEIRSFVLALLEFKVHRKDIGYSLKDVEI